MWVFFFLFSLINFRCIYMNYKIVFFVMFFFLVDDESEENVDRDFVGCD